MDEKDGLRRLDGTPMPIDSAAETGA